MNEPQYPPDLETALFQKAINIFNQYSSGFSEKKPIYWNICWAAAEQVKKWNLPENCCAAALLIPILKYYPEKLPQLQSEFGFSIALAQRILEWQVDDNVPGATNDPIDLYIYKLRYLLRQNYIDYPDFSFTLLLFALHDACYQYAPSLELARQSQIIFIPMAEILTVWDMRQIWQEKSTAILVSEDPIAQKRYEEILSETQRMSWASPEELDCLIQRYMTYLHEEIGCEGSSEDNAWFKANKKLIVKAYAFKTLKVAIFQHFEADHITPIPQIDIRFLLPGDLYLRELRQPTHRETNSTEEILHQIWVSVCCKEEQDCYRALHAIHSLGKPVTPRFSDHFDDNIAAVLPNGYRALRTSIVYSYPTPSLNAGQTANVLVEFRILTERMRQLNAEGVIQAFYKSQNDYTSDRRYSLAWWHPRKIEQLNEQLSKKFHLTDFHSFGAFVKKYKLDATPENATTPQYIFTPMGDIIFMEQGCMPLDFAYQIHSDLGNHAAQVKVNGKTTSYNYALHNGDLVEITYDRQFSGPDLSWLGLVRTSRARQIIRKCLAIQLGYQSPGRVRIQEELERTIVKYRSSKHYDLRITTSKLDAFLEQYADLRSLPNLEALYDSIKQKKEHPTAAGAIHPHTIIERLVANELAGSLVDENRKPLEYSHQHIKFCEACRPVPGEAIVAYEHGKDGRRNITVHMKDSLCKHGEKEVSIYWAETPIAGPVTEFQIMAEDRQHLLAEILNCIYYDACCDIHRVEARARQDGSAAISVIVSSSNVQIFNDIRRRIEKTKGLRQVWLAPVSQHEHFRPSLPETSYNPYKQTDVYRRKEFYDREKQVDDVLRWLQDKSANYWQILHGQRRIGKTCFVEHLAYTVLPENGLAFPVYVNLLALVDTSIQALAIQILGTLFTEIRIKTPSQNAEIPLQKDGESTLEWLRHGLEEAQKYRNGQPLFIILDELDYLIARGKFAADSGIFRSLLYLMRQSPFIRWLLVISDTVFNNPSVWGDAADFLNRSDILLMPALEPNYAIRMIREPAEVNGFKFPDSDKPDRYTNPCFLVSQIREASGENPYYIKRICYHLIDRLRSQGRTNISIDDLDHAFSDVLINGQIYFDHFLHNLTSISKRVLVISAHHCTKHNRTLLTDVLAECKQVRPHLGKNEAIGALTDLDRWGCIKIEDSRYIYFPVKIFARYVEEILSKQPEDLNASTNTLSS